MLSDFCMGAVFMSVILHGMLFDVFATPHRTRCSRHNTASHRRCSRSLAGKRGPHSVAAVARWI